MSKIVVSSENAGLRLDVFCESIDPNHTRSYFKRLIDEGKILVGGKKEKAGYKVSTGDTIEIDYVEAEVLSAKPEDIALDIVYEDSDIIVVNKPQGMVVHPAPGNPSGTLVNALAYHTTLSTGAEYRPGIVHRIDKDTAGLLVVAKNDMAHANLSSQISSKRAKRTYVALVQGTMNPESGTIDKNIDRSKRDRKKYTVVDSGGRSAITHYRTLDRYRGYSLVEFTLETGRTHQIRVHAAYMHHPIVGDSTYNPNPCKFSGVHGQLLVAKKLTLMHPRTGKEMTFEIDLPPYFVEVLNKLAKEAN